MRSTKDPERYSSLHYLLFTEGGEPQEL